MSSSGDISGRSSTVGEVDDDEISVIEEDDDHEEEVEEGEGGDDDDGDDHDDGAEGALVSRESQGSSVVEWEEDRGAQSQVPRGFMERIFWNESDVMFTNDTDREVLFIIADEEFTLKRTSKTSSRMTLNDDSDDNGEMSLLNFELNLIPLKASANASSATTVTRHALRTRCMPVAPRSHSTQHFQQERLTYVTAMTKDEDGEGNPWTRVHYENKVINCQRTKSLKFCRKHLRVSAYRVRKQQPPKQIADGKKSSSTALVKRNSKRFKLIK